MKCYVRFQNDARSETQQALFVCFYFVLEGLHSIAISYYDKIGAILVLNLDKMVNTLIFRYSNRTKEDNCCVFKTVSKQSFMFSGLLSFHFLL